MTASKRKRRSGNPAAPPKPVYRPTQWHRDHRYALVGIVGATALTLLAGFLGPSAVTLTLGPRDSYQPPWYLPAGIVSPNEWFVSALIWAAIIIGAVALWVGMRALADGWKPRARRLFALGTTLTLLTITVPPMTSADVLMYAAYGRLQAIGMNPYDITPAEVFRSQFDPVLRWTERPWQDTPSVYGPITSWTQLMANKLGGENMHDIVFWLQVCSAVPFILVGAGAIMLARGDPRRQARAALLTIANPVLIWAVVAGAHNESLSVMFAVAGFLFLRKNPFLAGIGIGLAGCAKISIGLWGLAMLWAYRRQPVKALLLCAGTAIPMGLAYIVWQPAALFQVLRNGSYVSVGSWANPVFRFLDLFTTGTNAKIIVGVISYLGLDRDRLDAVPYGAVDRRPRPGQGGRPASRSADHRAAHRAGALGRLVDHLDVHPQLVRPDGLGADGRAGHQQAGPDHGDADRPAVPGLRPGPGAGSDRSRAGVHRHPDAGHDLADRPVRRAARGGALVAAARPARAVRVPEAGTSAGTRRAGGPLRRP